ncbi:hypothetical protein LTR37_000203 [Vermiconidia calcicola]|uniref:Uncharacterized protein n=1 Tax=Vermiconidia calcicola TaxID=1690605 RepID=A0ACC3NZ65_9PEZI|nr:hypothetical protein LTR37_000203 [Vermiconidia calcicola]
MVATRRHPQEYPDPDASPAFKTVSPPSTPTSTSKQRSSNASSRPTKPEWSHTPSNLTLIWLAVSLPLVVWDTGYVLLRPHSMPGGALHKPIWSPYKLYGEVDMGYGFKAYNEGSGWTGAQGLVNGLETTAYFVYLYIVYAYGEPEPRQGSGAPDKSVMGQFKALSESRTVYGKMAGYASLLAFSTATVTFWKTILYWLIELFSGFDNIGHNSFVTLFFVFIIPNIAWIIVPGYMIYVFGVEILDGLEIATRTKSSR